MGDPPAAGPCEAPGKAKPPHNSQRVGNRMGGRWGGLVGSLCSVVGVSGGEGTVSGGSQHSLPHLQPVPSCSAAHSIPPSPPQAVPIVVPAGQGAFSLKVWQTAAVADFGVPAALGGGLHPLSVSPPRAPRPPLSLSSDEPAVVRLCCGAAFPAGVQNQNQMFPPTAGSAPGGPGRQREGGNHTSLGLGH